MIDEIGNRLLNERIGPYPFPTIPVPVRHFVALASVLIAFLASRSTPALVDEGGLFLLMGIAVLGSAWFAGTGSALAVTILGALLGAVGGQGQPSLAVHAHLALFVLEGLLLTMLVAELRVSRQVAEHAAHQAHNARREVEAASRMKDEFLGTISHELRTPLNAVLGWLHLVRSGTLDHATEERGLEAIERNVRLQAQMTADLLDISRALTGRLHLETKPLPLKAVLDEALAQVASAARAKDQSLHVTVAPGEPIIQGDPDRLRQIVWHLLANAIKFTPKGGAIFVSLDAGETARITVRDTGPGVARDFLPRIFDRFTQEDSSLTRRASGLGVGLALIRELVERHGGEITVANVPEGGAVFTVRLPLHLEDQASAPVAPHEEATDAGFTPLDGIRVLLVDRDQDTRDILTIVLEQRGADVRVAAAIDEALEMLESWRPDVLVSDTVSPDRDEYALVGKVRGLEPERGGRIPALALTSLARADEGMRRMLSGVKRDLPKPVEPAVLMAEIARLTGREEPLVQR